MIYDLCMVDVIPSILEKEFEEIERKIKLVEGLVEWVQIDFADGALVPNTTFLDLVAFKNIKTNLNLEAHLMVQNPADYIKPLVEVNFKRFYAHIESGAVEDYIAECFKYNVEVGLAIDGLTPFEKIQPYLDNIDAVLVMAIEAGFSGRPFREDTVVKIKKIRETYFELPIAVDGAMNDVNSKKVVTAGANIIVSNSYIFNSANPKERIEILRNL